MCWAMWPLSGPKLIGQQLARRGIRSADPARMHSPAGCPPGTGAQRPGIDLDRRCSMCGPPQSRRIVMAAPVIQAQGTNLHLRSGGQPLHILRDVDLSLAAGEVAAVVGPSGSGKTSLLMVLSGLERATSGKIVVDGVDISRKSEDELAIFRRKSLGILFQNFHLIPSM